MSERFEQFQVDGTPRIGLRLPAGKARFVAGTSGTVEIRMSGRDSTVDRFLIEERGGEIVIEPEGGGFGRWSGVDVEIRTGEPAEIRARLAAGDVTVSTKARSLTIEAGSGDVTAGEVEGDVKVKTASGDIRVEVVGGRVEVAAASGDLHIGSVAGEISAKTAAGDMVFGEAAGSVTAHSASGDIEVHRFSGDSFNAKTLSGDVRLGVTSGRKFTVSFQTLSGDVRTDFPVAPGGKGSSARLAVKTMSGDVTVHRAD
ncbi:MAG: DUF4097 family beta strand repeat-containing protein [Acidimicrobiia bacterium]